MRAAGGAQWTISRGTDRVTVVEVGGGLREWTRDGVKVLAGYDADEMCLAGRGQLLMPWPNRIRDGRWTYAGTERQLPLTEPKLGNASHGLVRFAHWSLVDRTEETLTVGFDLDPQPGWDWSLRLETTYALSDAGLTVTSTARNVGSQTAPFGYGAHPYVNIGEDDPATIRLTVPAARSVDVDERMLPTGLSDVDGTDLDFRTARPIGATALDTAFTGLARDDDRRWRVRLDGLTALPTVAVWGDEAFGWAQVFTGKAAAEGEHGIAVEPMSCPADAFNSGTDVVHLAPGEHWSGTWGISLG